MPRVKRETTLELRTPQQPYYMPQRIVIYGEDDSAFYGTGVWSHYNGYRQTHTFAKTDWMESDSKGYNCTYPTP